MFDAEPEVLTNNATHAAACLGELEGNLKTLASSQDELHTAVVSAGAGQAIYNTLGNAHAAGVKLAGTLQQIIDALTDSGGKIEMADLDAQARVYAAAGADGILDGGTAAGTWTVADTAVNSKVDTNTW
ncbi:MULTISPECIES: hypothetical protein [unclassified Nocardia]|uniref:hypothetical protein n=1 Tax=unclassified Nocardia TaxID=2637762 RepID=UPI00278C4F5E|nr:MULTISPECIES: hypothetical protein [unclassified Nocardia]